MCKNRFKNLIIVFLSVLFALILGVSTAKTTYAAGTIDYETTIRITEDGEGLYFGNNDANKKRAASLQAVFDEIDANLGQGSGKNPEIEFVNITTDNRITLDYPRIFVLTGSVLYTGASDTSFITVKRGTLYTSAGDFKSEKANLVKINVGAKLETSGHFAVNGAIGTQNVSTIRNDGGTVVMTGGEILSQNTDDFTGIAYYQSQNGKIEMSGGVIDGQTAAVLQSGSADLRGGTIKTSKRASTWDNAGIALQASNAATVELNGTTIGSYTDRIAVSFEGNGEGEIKFNAGVVKGEIVLSKTSAAAYGGFVYVNGRKLRQVVQGRIVLYSDNRELTINNGRLKFVGDKESGYYSSSWNKDSSKGQNPFLSSFAEGETIMPDLSNLYAIKVVIGTVTNVYNREYGSNIDLSDVNDPCYTPAPNGYVVSHWSDGSNTGTEFIVTGEMTLTATLRLVKPVIGDIENLYCTYDRTEKKIFAEVNKVDGLTYTYLWEKADKKFGIWAEYGREEAISVKNHSDSGEYRLTLGVGDGEQTESVRSAVFTVQIDKTNYSGVTHRALNGTYNEKFTLRDYELDDGFYWEDDKTVPIVGQTEYRAKYCADKDNYNEFSLDIKLVLKKAARVPATHPAMTGDYVYDVKKTLADYPFKSNEWRWADSSTIPQAGQNSYEAYYNPDRDNYEDYLGVVQIDIAKANYSGIKALVLSAEYTEKLTAGKVFDRSEGTQGYRISNEFKDVVLESVQRYEFKGYYNADIKNYNDFEVKIFIDVKKGRYSDIYYGNNNTVDGGNYRKGKLLKEVALKDGFYWYDDNLPVEVDNDGYKAYYNKDFDRYNNYDIILKVDMRKGQVPQDERIYPETIKGVYSPEKTLAEYPLPAGFVWQDATYVPEVSEAEYCVAIFRETESYYAYTVNVKVELSKADYDLSKAKFTDKTVAYDGQPHGIVIEGVLPDGVSLLYYEGGGKSVGRYTVYAVLSQEDEKNYNAVGKLSANLVIEKGNYDMSGVVFADDTVVYDGNKHTLVVSGRLPDGVSVSGYSEDGYVNSGAYKITVSFTQEDSENYKKVNELSATLTIMKAQCVFLDDTIQQVAYDGTDKKPVMKVNNDEQTVFDDAKEGFRKFGRYKVKFYTLESMNYLPGEISVRFDVIGHAIASESGEQIAEVFDLLIEQSGTLTVETKKYENSMTVTLLIDGKSQDGLFGVKIAIPESFTGKDVRVDCLSKEGKRASCDVKEEDGYLWLTVNKLGKFDIYVGQHAASDGSTTQWWIWLIIALSCAIAAGGLTVLAIFLFKKRKSDVGSIKKRAETEGVERADEVCDLSKNDSDKGDDDGE